MILPFPMVKSCSIYMFNRHSVLPKTWRCSSSNAIPKNTRYMGGGCPILYTVCIYTSRHTVLFFI